MQGIQKKIKTKGIFQKNLDENKFYHFDIEEIMLQNVLNIFKKKIEKYTDHVATKKILSHTKKVFSFFMTKQVVEVLLIINKKKENNYEIEFKVLPSYYINSKKLKMGYMSLYYTQYEYPKIIKLNDFYLKNIQYYISDSGGNIS